MEICDIAEEMLHLFHGYHTDKPDEIVNYSLEENTLNLIKYMRIIVINGFLRGIHEVCDLYREDVKRKEWLFADISPKVKDAVDQAFDLPAEDAIKKLLPLVKSRKSKYDIAELSQILAIKYEEAGNWEEARQYFSQNMLIFPPTGRNLLGRARANFHLEDYENAILDLEQALHLSPRQTYVLRKVETAEAIRLLELAKQRLDQVRKSSLHKENV
jgi:tetratricopeptide (TPR) repeat protein